MVKNQINIIIIQLLLPFKKIVFYNRTKNKNQNIHSALKKCRKCFLNFKNDLKTKQISKITISELSDD